MSDSLLEQLARKDKVLSHVQKLIQDVETYCDREMLQGIKNVISLELEQKQFCKIDCPKGGTIMPNPIRDMFAALSDLVTELHEKSELTEAESRLLETYEHLEDSMQLNKNEPAYDMLLKLISAGR